MNKAKDYPQHCNRCGRILKDKSSIKRGYGPRCWEIEHEEPDLIFLLKHGSPVKTEYGKYLELYKKQISKKFEKLVI